MPLLRIACASSTAIVPCSPVTNAAPIGPLAVVILAWICLDKLARALLRNGLVSDDLYSFTSPKADPVAPIPENQARRAKSYPPGSAGPAGGISRARNNMIAPGRKSGRYCSVLRFMRILGGKPACPPVSSSNRTISRAARFSTLVIRPYNSPIHIFSSTGRSTSDDLSCIAAKPSAINTPVAINMLADLRSLPKNRPKPMSAAHKIPRPIADPTPKCCHKNMPVPMPTGVQSGNWSRSFANQFSIACEACAAERTIFAKKSRKF